MRIAIVHEAWGAGAARCAKDLERELGRRHDVLYLPRTELESAESALKAISKFLPDVVNCHSFYGNFPYQFLCTVARRYPTCFTIHDPRPIGAFDVECWNCSHNATCRRCPLLGSRWRQFLRNPYFQQRKVKRGVHARCPDNMRIVAPSLWMLNRIAEQELKRFGLSHIPYGIDLDHFKYISGGREYFNLPNDQPVILFSAWYETKRAVGARKGLADLAAAFLEHVLPAVPNAILAVAGESFAPNHPSVRPLGLVGVESVPRLLSAADVYVLPTLADNFPYTILEAMACGTPVIATNVGGIPEQIVDGHNGLIVPPSSPIALGKAIVDVLLNTENAKLMGLNGRKRAVERYSMNSFVDSYERLFNLLSKSDQHRLDAR